MTDNLTMQTSDCVQVGQVESDWPTESYSNF